MKNEIEEKVKLVGMLYAHPWFPVFEGAGDGDGDGDGGGAGDGDGDGAGSGGAGDGAGSGSGDKSFSQEQVNKMLADERRKGQTRTQKAIDELEALKAKSSLSDKDRTDLEKRIETMQNELLTKEELAKKEQSKLVKKHEKELETLTTERDSWRQRFTESTIVRSITDAAVQHEAYVPSQVVALLRPNTRLTEALDEQGNPTGDLIPKVEFADTDNDGKPIVLDFTVPEAVKRMKEMEIHGNLFKGAGTGGLGGNNKGGGGSTDITEVAKNQAEYRRLRKEGKLDL